MNFARRAWAALVPAMYAKGTGDMHEEEHFVSLISPHKCLGDQVPYMSQAHTMFWQYGSGAGHTVFDTR